MPPPKKRKRLFPTPPAKTGVAAKYLSDNFNDIPDSITDMKNGHILYLYLSNCRNVKQTCSKLKELPDTSNVPDFTYSVQRLVWNSLEKFHRLTVKKEMDNFKDICTEAFYILPQTPRPKPAVPIQTFSSSPVKTRKTAACVNCQILNSLRKAIKARSALIINRKRKSKLKPKQLNAKLERRDNTIKRLKKKFADSEVTKLKDIVVKLQKVNGVMKKRISALDVKLKNVTRANYNELKDMETDYQTSVLILEEKIMAMKSNAPQDLELQKDGKFFKYQMRIMVYECLMANVPTEKIPSLICSFAFRFGVNLDVKEIPVRSSVQNMVVELGVISDLQAAELIFQSKNVTIGFDATTQEGIHVNAIHTTTEKECLVVALDQLAGGTTNDYAQHITSSIDHLANVFSEFHPEMTFSHVKEQLISHISCTLTDRAAANHAAIRIVNEVFGKSLIEVNCHLHPLDTIATKCRSALLSLETEKSKLFGQGCLAEKVILGLNKMRFKDGKGDPHGFRVFLHDQNLPQSLIIRYRGNRLHVLFKLAAVYVIHHKSIMLYLTTRCLQTSALKTSLTEDFSNTTTFMELKVLGVLGKMLTGPWLKRFYRNSEKQSHHMDAFDEIKLCLQRINEYLCNETVSIQTLKEDFFGDPIDRSDEALWRDDGHTRSFSVMFKAVLVATADVVKR